jgi:hypothetical protein
LLLNVHLDDVSERRSAASVSNLRSAMEQTERLQRALCCRPPDRYGCLLCSLKRASNAVIPMSTVADASPSPQRSNRQRHSRAHRAQGIGCSPQRNKGGGAQPRGTFAEGSTRCPVHAP